MSGKYRICFVKKKSLINSDISKADSITFYQCVKQTLIIPSSRQWFLWQRFSADPQYVVDMSTS